MSKASTRAIIGLGLLVVAVLLVVALPVKEYLVAFLTWARELGPWGATLLALIYIPACLLFVPGSLLTLGAGFAFGVVTGTIAVSLGATAGAAAAFVVGRTLAREWVERMVADYPRFTAIDRAVACQGFRIVLLTRLSPLFPFNFLNYAFGITRVTFRDYLLASWIGMLPGTAMYVYLGSAAQSLTQVATGQAAGGSGRSALFVVGLIATVAVTVTITRIAARALREQVPTHEERGAARS